MKTRGVILALGIALGHFHSALVPAETVIRVEIQSAGSYLELTWPAQAEAPVAGTSYADFQIQKSRDLRSWELLPSTMISQPAVEEGRRRVLIPAESQPHFYRVTARVQDAGSKADGAEVFGYSAELREELARLGQISVETFQELYAPSGPAYLTGLSWDPRRAAFWDEFNTDPAVYNARQPSGSVERRLTDFRLNEREMMLFLRNGFVVSERLGSYSFADSFYQIFIDDLPVFVSTDAILHAWHRSYLAMLEELEEVVFHSFLENMLGGMSSRIAPLWTTLEQTPLRDSLIDADYYLTVARSLLAGVAVSPQLTPTTNVLDTLEAIARLEYREAFPIFGVPDRTMDFSQFRVRGNYERSERMERYFRAMIWCGRIDLRIAGPNAPLSQRQLATSIVLHDLLRSSGQFETWRQFDQALQQFVGWTDSLTFDHLQSLREEAGISSLSSLAEPGALARLQERLLSGQLGLQQIRSDVYLSSPFGTNQIRLPRSFTVLGQKFILDSWALSQMVFDSLLWNGQKVMRRLPSGLDIAFSVFGNDSTTPELVRRITTQETPFRDGYPYQPNLAAVRNVIDRQSAASWGQNIYLSWLSALRALSPPTTDPAYPEVMRTQAWAMKNLNTQLASWTQLRHDTLLYSKQSYTGGIICSYPYGFVEPRVEFWEAMRAMASRSAELIGRLPFKGQVEVSSSSGPKSIALDDILRRQTDFLKYFANTMNILKGIASKELAQQSLDVQETVFMKDLIERHDDYFGIKQYSGWYPYLFYRNLYQEDPFTTGEGSDVWDALIADVHTDVPAPELGDKGAVLHQAVGNVNLLLIAVDNGPDKMVYAGPVLSYYEFAQEGVKRWADSEWKKAVWDRQQPAPPEWTRSYLVPDPIHLEGRQFDPKF